MTYEMVNVKGYVAEELEIVEFNEVYFVYGEEDNRYQVLADLLEADGVIISKMESCETGETVYTSSKTTVYECGWISQDTLNHGTEKAFFSDYDHGYYGSNHTGRIWIPRSICKFFNPNDLGNLAVMIPRWFFRKNNIQELGRISAIHWTNTVQA